MEIPLQVSSIRLLVEEEIKITFVLYFWIMGHWHVMMNEVVEEVISGFSNLLSLLVLPKLFVQGIEWCPNWGSDWVRTWWYTLEEIKKVVFQSDRSKSSSSDGFLATFYHIILSFSRMSWKVILKNSLRRAYWISLSETFMCLW